MFNIIKGRQERKELLERQLKLAREQQLKKTLAQKCADIGSQYVSHKEDETEYTVVTINGETLRVRKEEIVIETPTDLDFETTRIRT